MKVEVNSDKPISDAVQELVVSHVESGLARHARRLTRAEVHLKNLGGSSKPLECTIEARPKGRDPVVVSDQGGGLEELVAAAAEKMDRRLKSLFGQWDSSKGGTSASGLPT